MPSEKNQRTKKKKAYFHFNKNMQMKERNMYLWVDCGKKVVRYRISLKKTNII